MVAKINSGKSMIGILNYNEHKVKEGVAKCIHASGFLGEAQLRFKDKLERFEMLTKMKSSVKTNAINISELHRSTEKLYKRK
jgi:hypothetical protein